MPEPMPSRPRRGSMTLSEALAEGLISKADFDKYMDEYLKKTYVVRCCVHDIDYESDDDDQSEKSAMYT